MAGKLAQLRLELIERVNEGLLKDLIDGLRAANPPVLTGREANQILQAHQVQEDRTGALVDMVCKKGELASTVFISILEEKDRSLAEQLRLLGTSDQRREERMEINEPSFR